jgi:hypothetical protein
MKKRRRVVVKERKLGREKVAGLAYFGGKLIEVDPRQYARAYLNTLIHETLHKIYPENSETRVKRNACTLTRVIWEARYRRLSK